MVQIAKRTRVKTASGEWVDLASSVTDLSQYYTKTQTDARTGLISIVPTGVSVGSGSGSVGTNGAVSFTGASSIQINGCFTNAYTNYLIQSKNYYAVGAVVANGNYQFVIGTTPSTGSYRWAGLNGYVGNSVGGASSAGSSSAAMGQTPGNKAGNFELTVFNPNTTKQTTWLMRSMAGRGDTNETYWTQNHGWTDDSTNTYVVDGIKFSFDNTVTGSINIYGYNNN